VPEPDTRDEIDRTVVGAWSLYDFANQAFTTLVVTFVYSAYFTQGIAADEVTGTTQWSWAVAVSSVLVAATAPYLGAMADRTGRRKRFLLGATVVCIAASTLLFFPTSGQVWFALSVFVVANVAFELSYVFYNAFLPEIAPADKMGRVSGIGWFVGYVGGLLSLISALAVFIWPESPPFGLSTETGAHVRATNVLVALWYAVFAVPLFLYVPEPRQRFFLDSNENGIVRATNRQLAATFRTIRQFNDALWLLAARFFYNDGVVTIFAFGGIYAAGTFGFDTQGIIVFGIVLNVAAALGAALFGYVDDWVGAKPTILFTLVGISGAIVLAAAAPNETWFWVAGILIGLLVGPNQSSSRSLMGRFTPAAKENEFFGFYAFSGKLTSFFGPLLLGWFTSLFDSQRIGITTVLVFFVLGGLLLLKVDEVEGMRRADTAEEGR